MSHVVNTVYTNRFQHLDSGGAPVTGLTQSSYSERVATLTASDGSVQATAAISIVEQSDGWYGYSVIPTATGDWGLSVVYSAVSPARRWGRSLEVLTAAQVDPASALSGNTVLTVSPIAQSGTLTLKRGDDYYAADGIGRTIQWIDQYSRWPDLTDALITFGAKPNPRTGEFITVTGSVIVPTGEGKTIRVEFTTPDTETMTPGKWTYDVQAVTSPDGHNVTLVSGPMVLEEDFVP